MKNNIDQYLNKVEEHYSIKQHKATQQTRVKSLIEFLQKEYKEVIETPYISGSYAKGTMINSKFDVDIIVPFKKKKEDEARQLKSCFDTLYSKKLKDYVHEKSEISFREEKKEIELRKQKVSIGLLFQGKPALKVDLVPALILDNEEGGIKLYINRYEMGKDHPGRLIKSNIKKQIKHIQQIPQAAALVRLLKVWRNNLKTEGENGLELPSFLLELLVISSLQKGKIPKGQLCKQLLFCMKNMLSFLESPQSSIKDPGNKNNKLLQRTNPQEGGRKKIIDCLKNSIQDLESKTTESDKIGVLRKYFPMD